eukprot:TRINITY_DN10839_c0_g1_i1.p1 TRINITY_DN10839_c0_g1~~TRINITY_DN10839_c0_g1_i1.p1  ORF type:complete len:224 (-),score=31.44 TRINITY_DN10839_c0_g1_i1:395-1066(-)
MSSLAYLEPEIQYACKWWRNQVYLQLPAEQSELFEPTLRILLYEKIRNHWYPSDPFRGQAYRCLSVGKCIPPDPTLIRVCETIGLQSSNILHYLPKYVDSVYMWIDPRCVVVRVTWDYSLLGSEEVLYLKPQNNPPPLISEEKVTQQFPTLDFRGNVVGDQFKYDEPAPFYDITTISDDNFQYNSGRSLVELPTTQDYNKLSHEEWIQICRHKLEEGGVTLSA